MTHITLNSYNGSHTLVSCVAHVSDRKLIQFPTPTQPGTSARLSDLVQNLEYTGPNKYQRRKNWKQPIVAEWLATIYSLMIISDVGDDDGNTIAHKLLLI